MLHHYNIAYQYDIVCWRCMSVQLDLLIAAVCPSLCAASSARGWWWIGSALLSSAGPLYDCRVPAECPQWVADLIESCMQQDPAQRPTSREVYQQLSANGKLSMDVELMTNEEHIQ